MVGIPAGKLFQGTEPTWFFRQLQTVRKKGGSTRLRGVEIHAGRKHNRFDVTAWKVNGGIGLILEEAQQAASSEDDFSQSVNILDSITDAFFLLDADWNIAYLSPKAQQFLEKMNMSIDDLLGKNILKVFPAAAGSRGYALLQKVQNEDKELEFEEYYEPLKTWFEIHAHPMAGGISVYVRDITRRKLAEAAFLKLSNAVEQSADAVFVTDVEGVIEYINPAFETITGYKRGEVLGETPRMLGSSEGTAEFERMWRQVQAGEIFRAAVTNRRKNGEIYFADETITPVRNQEGIITHFVAILRDITERKRTEERFQALIENSTDGIAILDAEGTVQYTGPSTSRILGYRKENFSGRSAFEFVHPDDRRSTESAFRTLVKKPGHILTVQFRMKHLDGTWKWIEATVNNLLREPSLQALVVNYRDISDRKIIEEALRKSEIEYRNLFDRANDAIFIFEPNSEIILEANNRACDLYSFTKEELIGMSLKQLTKDVARGEQEINDLLRHKSSRNFETVHFNKTGHPIEMLVNSSVVEYSGRTAIMSIIRDVTELRRLEHQLRQAQKMESIGTLAGGIAHDFNNILSIILGYTSLLKRGKIDTAKYNESLDTITKAAKRGATLVKQVLTFARKTDIVFESVKLNDLLVDLSKLLSETFPKTIEFKFDLDPSLPTIIADSNQLHQVFLNLCVNARDAMPHGGSIQISSQMVRGSDLEVRFQNARQSEYVHIAVKDTGSGMDEETRSRVFEPFFTTKGQGSGTGLGLAVVYGIVDNHHGFIEIESAPGKGTTFHLYFPVQMRSLEPLHQGTESTEDLPRGTETILVVEDEQMLQFLVKELLESHGYTVLTADDGSEAIDVYIEKKDSIDLVLTDIGLPKLSGWDVCKKILALNPNALLIVASGYLDPNAKSDLKESKAKEFLHKPYLPEEVLNRVREVLDRSR